MKPSIACIALLVSLLAFSHGIEQQVGRWEHFDSGSLFVDLKGDGVENRQSYDVPQSLPPTPSAGQTQTPGDLEILPPTPSSTPTYCYGANCTGGGNETVTPPPGTCWPPISSSVNTSYCYQLIDCLDAITGTPFNFCGAAESDVCNALLLVYGGPKGVEAMCNVANLFRYALARDPDPPENEVFGGPSSTDNAKTRKLVAPQCLPPVDPAYADESGESTGYDNAVASIIGTYIQEGKSKRTNDDAVGTFLIGLGVAITADAAGEGCDSEVAVIFTAGGCLAARTAAKVTLGSLEIVQNQIDFHDGGIDSSEILATLENTKTILMETCNIIGQVDSFEMNVTRRFDQVDAALEVANDKLDSIQKAVDEANQKLDRILCPFGPPPGASFTVLGQGCDATDQNCNNVTDECAEDNVPPSITLMVPIPDMPFKSTDEALAFLLQNVIVSDDCAANFQTDYQLLSDPNCCDCQFRVTTADERCAMDNDPGMATASRIFVLNVDSAAPVITCGFFTQQDPFHVSGGFDPCGGLPVPFPGENDPLHIDQACFGQGLFDVELWYQIEDECDNGVLPVTVRVLSNEFSEDKMALIVERQDLPDVVHRARVYVSPTSCQDDKTVISGKGSKDKGSSTSTSSTTTICEIEETEDDSVTTRFYDIIIAAKDAAGNVGTTTCSIIVIPDDHYCGDDHDDDDGGLNSKKNCNRGKGTKGIPKHGVRHLTSFDDLSNRNRKLPKQTTTKAGKGGLLNNEHSPDDLRIEYALSTQRYVISELTLEWDPNLNTNLTVPDLPEPETTVSKNGKSTKATNGKGKSTKSGQRSCSVSCEGRAQGKKGKKKVGGIKEKGTKRDVDVRNGNNPM